MVIWSIISELPQYFATEVAAILCSSTLQQYFAAVLCRITFGAPLRVVLRLPRTSEDLSGRSNDLVGDGPEFSGYEDSFCFWVKSNPVGHGFGVAAGFRRTQTGE